MIVYSIIMQYIKAVKSIHHTVHSKQERESTASAVRAWWLSGRHFILRIATLGRTNYTEFTCQVMSRFGARFKDASRSREKPLSWPDL